MILSGEDNHTASLPNVEEAKLELHIANQSSKAPYCSNRILKGSNIHIALSILLGISVVALSVLLAVNRRDFGDEIEISGNGIEKAILKAVERQNIVPTISDYEFKPRSIQYRALQQVNKKTNLSKKLVVQLYALWCFYLATEHVQTSITDEQFGFGTVPHWTDGWTNDGPDMCLWYGVRCNSKGLVTELILSDNALSGALPIELKLLSSLGKMNLSDNLGLGVGGMPAWLGDFPSLQLIDLTGCNYSGEIPTDIIIV